MAPVFSPTSPPTMLLLPLETPPLADDQEIVPAETFTLAKDDESDPPKPPVLLLPTRPPAKFSPAHESSSKQPSATVTFTAAVDPVMVPMLKPASPPALMPA